MISRPHVAIIGGGIGGLFAANALAAQGIRISVYEQAPAIGEIGAGVFLTPNSVRHLQRMGLESAVEKWGARVGPDSRYFRHDGAPIAPVQVTDSSGWNATFGMHRADLVAMLADALPAGTVHTGHRCCGFEQDGNTACVSFANGVSVEADVVIAADGIHSELRSYVVPSSRPVFSGSVAYRGLVPHERVPHWPTYRWALYDREPLPLWTRERLSLLGDAAHPMLPHLGQGANQSIEDGMALATILKDTDRKTAPKALLAYERLRRERVAQV